MDLAREADVICQLSFHRESVAFCFTHLTRIAIKYFNPAGGTACITAATVQDVDACIFYREDEFLAGFGFKRLSASCSFSLN
jgi:hypothetical protein